MSLLALGVSSTAVAAPCPPPGQGEPALYAAARALGEGQACEIPPDMSLATLQSAAGGSPVQWTDSGTWDPMARQIHWIGRDAGCGTTSRPFVHLQFDDDSAHWSLEATPPLDPCGHGYEGNALDPVTGDQYFRRYGDDAVWVRHGGTWAQTLPVPGPSSSPAIALAYFPELQLAGMTEPGALVWAQQDRLYVLPRTDGATWSEIMLPVPIGDYHNVAEYNPVHHALVFGGGNNADRLLYKLAADGALTQLSAAPVDIGIHGVSGSYVSVDPVSGQYLVYAFTQAGGAWWTFDLETDTWATLTGPPALSLYSFQVPIPEYGVVALFDQSVPTLWVYRHEPSTPQPPPPPSGGGDSTGSPDGELSEPTTGGCSASGPPSSSASLVALALVFAGSRRRRRTTRGIFRARAVAGLLCLAVVTSGCSMLWVDGPHVRNGKVECTQEMTLPLLDAVVGVSSIVLPFVLNDLRDRTTPANMPLYIALWGTGVASSLSSVIGIQKVKRCRRTLEAPMPM